MRTRSILLLLALPLAAVSCGGENRAYEATSEDAAYVEVQEGAQGGASVAPASEPPPVTDRVATATVADTVSAPVPPAGGDTAPRVAPSMIIRTGRAVVEVDSLELAIAAVQKLAAGVGGYVANTSLQAGNRVMREATLELKIPAARFDQALAGLRPLGKVETVNVTAEDVGEEFVDVTARVTNARRLEERLITLLATRTGRLEDVLAVERELARVREEIERYEGRLRYLRTRTSVSTLTVVLHEPRPIVGDYPGQNPIVRAFRDAWRNFVGFVAWLIAALGWMIPLALVLAFLVWLVRRFFPRRPPGAPRPPGFRFFGRSSPPPPPPAPPAPPAP